MAAKLHRLDDEQVGKCWHGVRIGGEGQPRWLWNGSLESPTFTPSIHIGGVCHSYVINGTIQFLLGTTHSRSGQRLEIPDWNSSVTVDPFDIDGKPFHDGR